MRTRLAVGVICASLLALGLSAFAECDHGGGGGGGGGDTGQRSGQVGRSSGSGASHLSAAAIANYQALKQAGYYRDAKTGAWYYQPDLSKAAVRVAGPPVLIKSAAVTRR